jgi:hypothetical protein
MGGRPPTVAEKGKEKLDSAKQRVEDEARSVKHETEGDKSLTEKGKEKLESAKERVKDETRDVREGDKSLTQKGKEVYKDNMPESMGGRPPTVAEKGKEKLDSAKQRVEDETRSAKKEGKETLDSAKQRVEDETRSAKKEGQEKLDSAKQRAEDETRSIKEEGQEKMDSAKQRVEDETRSAEHERKTLLAHGKEWLRDTLPQGLGGRPPTAIEQEQTAGKSLLQRGKEFVFGGQHTSDEDHVTQQVEDMSIDNRPEGERPQDDVNLKGKSLAEQAKAIYRENMPESLGGRSPTLAEQGKQRISDETRSAKEVGQDLGEKAQAKAETETES